MDWRGITAAILAFGVVAVLLIGAIGAAVNHERIVSTDELGTVATVLGAAIGAVAVYLGGKTPPPGGRGSARDDTDDTGA